MTARGAVRLGAALVLAGLGFATASLLVPGVALLLLAALARGWVALATSARVERLPGPARLVEGDPYPLRVRIDRRGIPLPAAELRDPLLRRSVPVGPRRPSMISVALRFDRRGRRELAPPRLALTDPLRLCEREISGTGATGEVLVLPRTEEIRRAAADVGGRDAGILDGLEGATEGAGAETGAHDLEIDGLRPYRQGSPASRIHWRTVARSGEMYERRFVAGADAAPLVVLDASDPPSEPALDRAVRAAASLCLHLARRGGCAALLGDQGTPTVLDPRLRAWPDLHARLALAQPGDPRPAPRAAAGRLGTIWVSGASAAAAAAAAGRVAPGAFVVTPDPARGAPVAFTVAGCAAQRANLVARASRPAPGRVAA